MECRCDPEVRKKISDVHKEVYGNGDSSRSMAIQFPLQIVEKQYIMESGNCSPETFFRFLISSIQGKKIGKTFYRIARLETNLKLLTSLTVSQFFLLVGVAVKTFLGAS